MPEWFVKYRVSSYVHCVMYTSISQLQNIIESFSMQTHLTHLNTILEYCHAYREWHMTVY